MHVFLVMYYCNLAVIQVLKMCTSHYYISIFKPVIIFILLCIRESPQVPRNCHYEFGIHI